MLKSYQNDILKVYLSYYLILFVYHNRGFSSDFITTKLILHVIALATAMMVSVFACDGIGESNKMFNYFLVSSYYITKLQTSYKNISTHTLGWNFESFD